MKSMEDLLLASPPRAKSKGLGMSLPECTYLAVLWEPLGQVPGKYYFTSSEICHSVFVH
jgi:hypothetical protein